MAEAVERVWLIRRNDRAVHQLGRSNHYFVRVLLAGKQMSFCS